MTAVADLVAETVVAAPAAVVWAAVGDPRRMPRWSPECVAVRTVGPVRRGVRTVNLNRRGWVVWPTASVVVRYEPGREIAWRVPASGTVWSLELLPAAGPASTRLLHRRVLTGGRPLVARLFAPLLGGVDGHDVDLAADMHRTLAAIRAELE